MKKTFTGFLFLLLCAQSAWGGDPFSLSTGWIANRSRFEVQKEFTFAAPNPDLFSAEVRQNLGDYFGSGYHRSDEPVEETLPNLDFTSLKNKLKVFLDDSVQISLRFSDDSKSFKPGYEYAGVDSFNNDPLGEKKDDQLSTFVVIKIDF